MNYYNEINPHAAQWIRNLISAGVIPAGDVDERSIEDVIPNDLRGYTQCHFFAGICGWVYALDLAGWPRDRPVWTGSCPCQPFSAAGKGAGFEDERHLWPAWQHLIAQCRPAKIFGEQVAGSDIDPWVDLVQADLEGMGYAFGCVPFAAAGIGAPFAGERAYWCASHSTAERNEQPRQEPCGRTAGRVGRVEQSVPWDTPWPDSLAILRALDDGLPRCVAGTDAARNAIVPQQAADFIRASGYVPEALRIAA
jgi:DNA (cytosine-5)-methyltransferase 1